MRSPINLDGTKSTSDPAGAPEYAKIALAFMAGQVPTDSPGVQALRDFLREQAKLAAPAPEAAAPQPTYEEAKAQYHAAQSKLNKLVAQNEKLVARESQLRKQLDDLNNNKTELAEKIESAKEVRNKALATHEATQPAAPAAKPAAPPPAPKLNLLEFLAQNPDLEGSIFQDARETADPPDESMADQEPKIPFDTMDADQLLAAAAAAKQASDAAVKRHAVLLEETSKRQRRQAEHERSQAEVAQQFAQAQKEAERLKKETEAAAKAAAEKASQEG